MCSKLGPGAQCLCNADTVFAACHKDLSERCTNDSIFSMHQPVVHESAAGAVRGHPACAGEAA